MALEHTNHLKKLIKSSDKSIKNKNCLELQSQSRIAFVLKALKAQPAQEFSKGTYRFSTQLLLKNNKRRGHNNRKTSQDEFGFRKLFRAFRLQNTENPIDPERPCGGSSGGAAGIAKKQPSSMFLLANQPAEALQSQPHSAMFLECAPHTEEFQDTTLIDFGNSLDKYTDGKTCHETALLQEVLFRIRRK